MMTHAAAQDPRSLMPDVSAAKAKEILGQAVAALGGPVYLNARDLDCSGRLAQFESSGAVGGYVQTRILKEFPDKYRVELDSKTFITDIYGIPINKKGHHIVNVYAGDHAWTLNSDQGVSELEPQALTDYQEQLKGEINMILRYRLNDDSLIFRYGGSDITDTKQVDWVEITDRDRRMVRVAIDKRTHVPVRTTVTTRNPVTGETQETARTYSNYRLLDGIMTPLQLSVFVNDRQVSQLFYNTCRNNSGLSPELFTYAGLQAQFNGKKFN
jgi:hypothetical protein